MEGEPVSLNQTNLFTSTVEKSICLLPQLCYPNTISHEDTVRNKEVIPQTSSMALACSSFEFPRERVAG